MRPDTIKKFDMFYLGAMALGVINTVIHYDTIAGQFRRELEAQGDGTATLLAGAEGPLMIGGVLLGVLITLLLWFLVSRQKIALVRWIIAALTAWNLLSLPAMLANLPSLIAIISLIGIALQIAAVYFVFQTESTVWLRGQRIVDDSDTHPESE